MLLTAERCIETGWVIPPKTAGGQDHLAVRAISEAMYAELVPGITNVTERVRCYSFYTWFTWWFSKHSKKKGTEEFVRAFRRAECLHALIGAQHGIDEEGADGHPAHGQGLAGRDALIGPLLQLGRGSLRLSRFADPGDRGAERYFGNDLGGLGQYYLGSLQQLDVMGGNLRHGVRVTDGRGVRVAEAYDSSVDGQLFWETVHHDLVGTERLRQLSGFCPCGLQHNAAEREVLLDTFLARDEHPNVPALTSALRVVLTFLDANSPTDDARDVVWQFRHAAYGAKLPSGEPWSDPARPTWASYQRHELLSVGIQSLLWAVLDECESAQPKWVPRSSTELAAWFVEKQRQELPVAWNTMTFAGLVEELRRIMPPVDATDAEAHECQLAHAALAEDQVPEVTRLVVTLLASLVARGLEHTYADFGRDARYFRLYELNLHALRKGSDSWQDLTVLDWLMWLVRTWCVGTHLRVALRKLRDEGLDTFCLRPADHGLVFVQQISPTWSNPRIAQLLRALRDLGLVDSHHQLLPDGRDLLGALRGDQ